VFVSVVLAQVDTSSLTKPLIVDPNAPSDAQQAALTQTVQILADEPASATQDPVSADDSIAGMLDAGSGSSDAAAGGGGASTTGGGGSSDSQAQASAITKEIQLLTSLVEHGKAIAAALPDKEKRLNELSAQLNAVQGDAAAKSASDKVSEQELLLAQINLKIAAFKKKLEDLETTQTKLSASVAKLQAAASQTQEVQHQLNQEAAVASVGGPAASGAAGAASFVDAANVVSREAEDVLNRMSRR